MSNLPKGWKQELLSDYLETIIDYRGKTPEKADKGILTLSAKSVKMGEIDYSQAYFISKETYKEFMVRGFPKIGDILMTTEAPLGCIAKLDRDDVSIAQRLLTLRGKEGQLDNDYLMYYLMSPVGQYELLSRASGSTVQGIKRSEFEKINIILPESPDEQKEIASILSSFDKKIELLKEQNHTLETMAQTIFKEWFVDFNYPNATGEMIDSEMGEIPKGWRVGIFDEIIEFINGYAFKSDELEKVEDIDSYAIFKMGHIKKGGGFNPTKTKDYISKNQCTKLEKYILKSGDILMCMTDMKDSTSLLGHTALMFEDEKYIVNQRVGLIRPNNNVDINYPWLYILTNSHGFISDLRNRANSGVQINLSTSEIKNTKIIIPDKETNKLFNLLTLPIFEKMKNIYFQIQTLEETRDSLLPKLMSGKTRIQGFKVD